MSSDEYDDESDNIDWDKPQWVWKFVEPNLKKNKKLYEENIQNALMPPPSIVNF